MNTSIAIVGIACCYPEAASPEDLWENALSQRRAFRRLPSERLRREDYYSPDAHAADRTYATEGAVIEGYDFDRIAFRVSGSSFRSADLAHWLALDIAAKALADAGFPGGDGLPRLTTGVVVGNTLTGEFSRANALRLRWPFVRRHVEHKLAQRDYPAEARAALLEELEEDFKSAFPLVDEETLAGGLSNTIAGRICNHFDLKGGGYTTDGACAASLLAVANACAALVCGDLDAAVAGGVDLSLDPFEIVGFAKAGALAAEEMRVFDRRSAGFWPGEGCGMVVLLRESDALAQGRRIYARIRGWGVSSDGAGGMTRPEVAGQIEAILRAYRRAGFSPESVGYCEAHGTGTAIGDTTELNALSRVRRESGPLAEPAIIGGIKANIGHTKAASGIAGLIQAVMALRHEIRPPLTSCVQPHELLSASNRALKALKEPELWPAHRPLRASVSAMGFGGINAHLLLDKAEGERRTALSVREQTLARSPQDAEVFFFCAPTVAGLAPTVESLRGAVSGISRAELGDLAAELEKSLGAGTIRAAVVASHPAEAAEKLSTLFSWLTTGGKPQLDFAQGVFLGYGHPKPRLGFLFPGQGAPAHLDGGLWARRFESVRETCPPVKLPDDRRLHATQVMQPAIIASSLAGLRVLSDLGLEAVAALGHSLGEISALHWGGAFSAEAAMRIARARGAAMAALPGPTGAMTAVAASPAAVQALLNGDPLQIVCYNSPSQTVVAGELSAVEAFSARAATKGYRSAPLPVSHAFHTPLMAGATAPLSRHLAAEILQEPSRAVFSTVTGEPLSAGVDVRELLCRQITSPVRFAEAFAWFRNSVDLLFEVGPGSALSGFALALGGAPVVPLDVGGESLIGLLRAVGAAFALGAPVVTENLFRDRFNRPFDRSRKPKFFSNPCESAPAGNPLVAREIRVAPRANLEPPGTGTTSIGASSALEVVRELVAKRVELPPSAVASTSRMLSDLHLSSITVGQLVADAAKQLGAALPASPTDYANASVQQIAEALSQATGPTPGLLDAAETAPVGIDAWVRPFAPVWEIDPLSGCTESDDRGFPANDWDIRAAPDHPLAPALRTAFAGAPGGGIVVCLSERPTQGDRRLLLAAAQEVAANPEGGRFILVQFGWGGSGLAKSLQLESPRSTVGIINVPADQPQAAVWARDEAIACRHFTEVAYDHAGVRRSARLRALPLSRSAGVPPLHSGDVVLVTGGGKGIAFECVLALARRWGARVALLGRSKPEVDAELAANLARLRATGVQTHYIAADAASLEAVRSGVKEAATALGPITAVLHAAGFNAPTAIPLLTPEGLAAAFAPKVLGLENVLDSLDLGKLRLLISFGSIIGRTGFRGEGHYALANEWLTRQTEDFQRNHPSCRCLAVEWSVWSGVGMGARLGSLETLRRQGVTPITPETGVAMLERLLSHPSGETTVIVTGRYGHLPTVRWAGPASKARRFTTFAQVHIPGVEWVGEVALSRAADPYVDEHRLDGHRLFPAVMGLEAMAQAAMAVTGETEWPQFEDVHWERPIVIPESGVCTLRLSALLQESGVIDVSIRSQETGYQADHFRATCRFGPTSTADAVRGPTLAPISSNRLDFDVEHDLYDDLLFHDGRFRRIRHYRALRARECLAELSEANGAPWFGSPHPSDLTLGPADLRDAGLHAIQACIPNARILPLGVKRVVPGALGGVAAPLLAHAWERAQDGDEFIFDLDFLDAGGAVVEQWVGLRLRRVAGLTRRRPWPPLLLAAHLERRLGEWTGNAGTGVALGQKPRREELLAQVGVDARGLLRRSDGKLETAEATSFSISHSGHLTLVVSGGDVRACDIESVKPRSLDQWQGLLSAERIALAHHLGGDADTAGAEVWAAVECLKKAGLPAETPLIAGKRHPDGWRTLKAGPAVFLAAAFEVQGENGSTVFGFLSAPSAVRAALAFEYPLTVSFEETNVVGNVYFANFVRWQGKVREQFLAEKAPGVMREMQSGLELVTLSVECRYLSQLFALDRVLIRMSLDSLTENSARMAFEYYRLSAGAEELVASGAQEIGAARTTPRGRAISVLPAVLREALAPYLRR